MLHYPVLHTIYFRNAPFESSWYHNRALYSNLLRERVGEFTLFGFSPRAITLVRYR